MRTQRTRGLIVLAIAHLCAGCFAEPDPVGTGSEGTEGTEGTDGEGSSSGEVPDEGSSSDEGGVDASTSEGATTEGESSGTTGGPPQPDVLFSLYDESCEGMWSAAVAGGSVESAPCALGPDEDSAQGGVRLVSDFESPEFGTVNDAVLLEPALVPGSLLQGAFFLEPAYFEDGAPRLEFTYEKIGADPGLIFQITTPGDRGAETLFDDEGLSSSGVELGLAGLSGEEISFVVIGGAVALYDARIVVGAP